MTTYLLEVSNELWAGFRTVALLQGLKVKDAIPEALSLFIAKHKTEQVKIDVKVIQNNKKNLLTFVYEEEIKNLLSAMIQAKKRKAPEHFIMGLKKQTLDIVKRHPTLSKDLADKIVTVFQNLT